MKNEIAFKSKLLRSCRIENFGAGYYLKLSRQYKKNQELSETFASFSKDELKHGAMFSTYFKKEYGVKVKKNFWFNLGKMAASLQFFVPLKSKLKMLYGAEAAAVKQIKKEMSLIERDRYFEILEKVLPDEIKHSKLYSSLYPV